MRLIPSLRDGLTPDQARRKGLVILFAATVSFADMNGDSPTGHGGTLDPGESRPERHAAVLHLRRE